VTASDVTLEGPAPLVTPSGTGIAAAAIWSFTAALADQP
jgi:hypothetical protein